MLFLIPAVFSLSAFSQTADSVLTLEKAHVTYIRGFDNEPYDTLSIADIDTSLRYVHIFDPCDQDEFLLRNTGNLGFAHFPVVFSQQPSLGLTMGYEQYRLYRFNKNDIRFYQNVHPYTRLNMILGQRKEQVFEVEHSQNIKKKFNFGFHYRRFATQGAYENQEVKHNGIAFTTRYESGKRYLLKSLLLFNNVRTQENGGVKDNEIFEDTSFVSKQLVDVELPDADNRQRDIFFHVFQGVNMGSFAAASDSGTASKPGFTQPKWQLYHAVDIGREQFEYSDGQPDSTYYGYFFNDDSAAGDYLSKAQKASFGTRLGLKKFFPGSHTLDFSGCYTYHIVSQDEFPDTALQNFEANFSFTKNETRKISYGIKASYSFLDYNKDDLAADAFFSLNFHRAGRIKAMAGYSRIQPEWVAHRFSFVQISWENDFRKQADFSAGLAYESAKYQLHISAKFHRLDGLLYWDENRLPQQSGSNQRVWVLELRKLFRIRYFGFDNIIRIQLLSDDALLRYPVYWGVHSLFYERGIFKGKLLTRLGTDIRYNTNYRAYGYFPLTGQFHLQSDRTLTFYPVMDVYLSFKIETVRFFLLMTHVNQGMFGDKGYFSAYKYPADDRHFRFGLSWMFLD